MEKTITPFGLEILLATQIEALKGNPKILNAIEKAKKEIDLEANIKSKGIDGLKVRLKIAIIAQRMENPTSSLVGAYQCMIEILSPYGSESLSIELQDFLLTLFPAN